MGKGGGREDKVVCGGGVVGEEGGGWAFFLNWKFRGELITSPL